MYIRKTYDVYDIFSDYGYGWEFTCGAENRKDAIRLLREYRENQPEYSHKIVKSREYKNENDK